MPPHSVVTGHRPNQHHPGVSDQTTGKPPSQTGLELGVVLEMTLPAAFTAEPATTPHQRRAAAAQLQVTNPLRPPVPHPVTAGPTVRTPRPLPGRFNFDLQAVNRIDAHTRQVQTNRHNIRYRGLPGRANLVLHRFQRGLTPIPRISTHPTHISAQDQLRLSGTAPPPALSLSPTLSREPASSPPASNETAPPTALSEHGANKQRLRGNREPSLPRWSVCGPHYASPGSAVSQLTDSVSPQPLYRDSNPPIPRFRSGAMSKLAHIPVS